MKSFLVIGIGHFGKHLALKLTELGAEVLAVDKDENMLTDIADIVTRVQICDCTSEKALKSLGVRNFDACFVAISENFQASLEITSLLKDLGGKCVISKADRALHEKFLLKNGADDVIHPERDTAIRTAKKYNSQNMFDYIELSDDFSIFEIEVPTKWVGKTITQVDVRSKYNVNILAHKQNGKVIPIVNANHIFVAGEHLIIAGYEKKSLKLLDTLL
jgi:trk system potassium uptake protein TrkA